MQQRSSITITPAEPIEEPASTSEVKSIFVSMSAAVRTVVEDPPGMTAFSSRPAGTPLVFVETSLQGLEQCFTRFGNSPADDEQWPPVATYGVERREPRRRNAVAKPGLIAEHRLAEKGKRVTEALGDAVGDGGAQVRIDGLKDHRLDWQRPVIAEQGGRPAQRRTDQADRPRRIVPAQKGQRRRGVARLV